MEDLGLARTEFAYHVVDGDRVKTYTLTDMGRRRSK